MRASNYSKEVCKLPSSLRGAKPRGNPGRFRAALDCFASLAMTKEKGDLEVHPAGDGFELADALLQIGDLDPRGAFAGATLDLARGAVMLQLAILEREPALPAFEGGGGEHDQANQGAGRDQQVLGQHHPVPFRTTCRAVSRFRRTAS